jgi:abortive infection bacteriophage resistance protein
MLGDNNTPPATHKNSTLRGVSFSHSKDVVIWIKTGYQKPPITFAEQVHRLESRGLVIQNAADAEAFLTCVNYERLSVYFTHFYELPQQFKRGTNFNDIVNLYAFDQKLKSLVFSAIELFEVSLRTQLAFHLSHATQNAHPHAEPRWFNAEYSNMYQKLIKDIERSQDPIITHYKDQYQEPTPPIWACVEVMSFGQLFRWYQMIQNRRHIKGISTYYDLSPEVLSSFFAHLIHVRNTCAHHGRLWNAKQRRIFKRPKQFKPMFHDADQNAGKTYNTLLMLNWVIKKHPFHATWLKQMNLLLKADPSH